MRDCGILFPIFSVPSKFGIGSFSREAYDFVDFLSRAGQGYWQILPLGPTGYGDSPYQPLSAFAGNPYFISPEKLIDAGFLTWEEANRAYFGGNVEQVDYGALYQNRGTLLRLAYDRWVERGGLELPEYKAFCKKEADWLEDYCLFKILKDLHEGKCWLDWDEAYKTHDAKALAVVRKEHEDDYQFYAFQQFAFQRQWNLLHQYAKSRNVKIIGDMPFYVSLDSADIWANPEAFLTDKEGLPTFVAGCKPDAFSATGQLWGNPIYDWAEQKRTGYKWWIRRIARNQEMFDVIRIDHFHGFAEYYAIPYGDETAENGTMEKGPGMDFFRALEKALGKVDIIAEDLGTVTKENQQLLKDSGFPGMKVLQFAFTSWNSIYLTHRHEENCVVYTGTHDNTTARAWIEEISDGDRDFTRRYLNSRNTDYGALVWDFIREAYRSVGRLCIIPLQDYLVKGAEARLNTPAVAAGNWQWRLRPNFLSDDLARSIREMAETYGRLPGDDEDEEPETAE